MKALELYFPTQSPHSYKVAEGSYYQLVEDNWTIGFPKTWGLTHEVLSKLVII